jgi:hypothetical protein
MLVRLPGGSFSRTIIAFMAFFVSSILASAATLTPDEMCAEIQHDVQEYLSTGHPCPCPYNLTRRGKQCGRLSAWSKPAGRAPRCYFEDFDGTYPPNPKGGKIRESWPPPPDCARSNS